MAALDLERLTVLLVEDSYFIRSLLLNSLKAIGVGKVVPVEDAGAAIEFIQLVKKDPMKAGVMAIDIVLTNWEMSPVDGMMLLRWVRRHKDSPDRFVPIIMITAYTEKKRIEEARDLGVNEMLAKPFTVKALMDKIGLVINRNRQFVHNKDYFGPDRRRQQLAFDGPERRKLTDDSPEVEIVRG
ncbi:MAG: response regulator [Alphaproteobacteria bacterium]|nr:MAG: response regulator [Alphaproteobacteria bacterium]